MAQFLYKVRDGGGDLATGTVEADSLGSAGAVLRGQGKFIVKLDAVKHRGSINDRAQNREAAGPPPGSRRIKREEVITFANQLAIMVETGVPISEALECVAEQTPNAAFAWVLNDIAAQVQGGGALSDALASHPKIFPTVMCSLVKASEMSGTMGVMLEVISTYLAKERATTKKIKGAISYPAVMLCMVIAVTTFLLVFVLPRFASIYQSKDAALPAPTRLLMAISDVLTGHWLLLSISLVVTVVGLALSLRSERGKRALDYLKLHTPVLGTLFQKLYVTRATQTMGTMITAGVPILDMIGIVRGVTCNRYFEDLWDTVDDRLRKGAQLSEPLFESKLIPRSVAQMIFAGEKSGKIGEVMNKIAHYTEEDFDEHVKQTTQYIEPALVAAMGLIIGFVAIALLLPIFKIGTVMGQ